MESSVAGHLIAGESARTGIRRELEEELFGLKSLPTNIKIKKICSYFNNDLPGNYEIAHLFEIIYSGPVQRQVEETEQPPMWVKWNFLVKDVKSKPQKYAKYFQNDIEQYILYRRGKDESSVEIISERHH